MISWGATKYYPGGHGTFIGNLNMDNIPFKNYLFIFLQFIGVVNSFVHIIMYTYYLLAAMGPQYQKFLWWKKYITNMQMVKESILISMNF